MKTSRPIRNVACVGEVMIELIAASDGTARLGVAGDTYNTAVYMARALRGTGVGVSYVTALGVDPYSRRILDAMRAHGLETDYIERREGMMPGLYAIDTDEHGERSFSYWRSASAARTLFSEPCKIGPERLLDFDLLFLSGITLAILPGPVRALLMGWLDRFRQKGGAVAYDSNHRPKLWESEDIARAVNRDMWPRADIALPSVDDELALFGDQDENAVLERLKEFGVTAGALKRGAKGPRNIGDRLELRDSQSSIKMVDSTAAGDSFNAGYLSAIALAQSDMEAMRAGHRLATKVIGSPGAIIPEP